MPCLAACFVCGCSVSTPSSTGAPSNSDGYTELITQLDSGDKPLEAVLTIPKSSGKPPVVILIQGSGPSDKDESIGPNKPFADIAHGLAQRGIASFRFDKRTFAYPEEFSSDPTIQGEMLYDAAAAIKQMKGDKTLGNIYVLGHSLGGMMAPKIAADNPDVAGIIIMAGTPRGLEDLIYDQNMAVLASSPSTVAQRDKAAETLRSAVETVKNIDSDTEGDFFGVPASYWASLNEIDTPSIARSLNIPMLILQGSADFQVSPDTDYNAWKELLEGHTNVSFKLYNGLNHLFMQSNGAMDQSEYEEAGVVDPQVIDDIATFIKEKEKTGV